VKGGSAHFTEAAGARSSRAGEGRSWP
jgi:hypothetical protein